MNKNDGYTLNLSVWSDNLMQTEGLVKPGEGTEEGEKYFFLYDGKDFVNGKLTIPSQKFDDGPVKITFNLNQPANSAQIKAADYKFSWIHARRGGSKEDYIGRGQRFDMEKWSENSVSFYLSNKMQYKSGGIWKTHDSVILALDVWVQHSYVDQLTNKAVKVKINCDPEIEIRPQ